MKKATCKHCGRNILKGDICKNCKSKNLKLGSGLILMGTFLFGKKGKELAEKILEDFTNNNI